LPYFLLFNLAISLAILENVYHNPLILPGRAGNDTSALRAELDILGVKQVNTLPAIWALLDFAIPITDHLLRC